MYSIFKSKSAMEIERSGSCEVLRVAGTHVELFEQLGIILPHVTDSGRSVIVHASCKPEYLRWWQRSNRNFSSSQALSEVTGTL